MVDICPHEPEIKRNSYFLIQPFDDDKSDREKAIEDALKTFYGPDNYEIKKSDAKLRDVGIYCEICRKIRSSEYCIADISGEIHTIVDKRSGEKILRIFLRANVALELGMAYGLKKPTIILSRSLNGMRPQIPSDIEFVRYIDITPTLEIKGWVGASQKILDYLRQRVIAIPMADTIDLGYKVLKEDYTIQLQKQLQKMIHLKKIHSRMKTKEIKINQIRYLHGDLIGVIRDAPDLVEDICFNYYSIDDDIEERIAILRVHHVQKMD